MATDNRVADSGIVRELGYCAKYSALIAKHKAQKVAYTHPKKLSFAAGVAAALAALEVLA